MNKEIAIQFLFNSPNFLNKGTFFHKSIDLTTTQPIVFFLSDTPPSPGGIPPKLPLREYVPPNGVVFFGLPI